MQILGNGAKFDWLSSQDTKSDWCAVTWGSKQKKQNNAWQKRQLTQYLAYDMIMVKKKKEKKKRQKKVSHNNTALKFEKPSPTAQASMHIMRREYNEVRC